MIGTLRMPHYHAVNVTVLLAKHVQGIIPLSGRVRNCIMNRLVPAITTRTNRAEPEHGPE